MTDPDKVLYEYFYSIEPLKNSIATLCHLIRHFLVSIMMEKVELLPEASSNHGPYFIKRSRKAYTWFEFDKEALPATINDDTRAFLYLEPSDESGGYVSTLPISLSNSLVGDDSDIYPPEIDAINISAYTTEDYPQRNFVKFDVDITNEASSGD